jgi:hypothetical protein
MNMKTQSDNQHRWAHSIAFCMIGVLVAAAIVRFPVFQPPFDMGLIAHRISQFYMFFAVYFIFMIAACFLLAGNGAAEIRNRITVFTGSLVVGMYFALIWFVFQDSVFGRQPSIFPSLQSPSQIRSQLLTPRLMWWLIPVFGALALHSAFHLLHGLWKLPSLLRNTIASYLIIAALSFGIFSPIPMARFWRGLMLPPDSVREATALLASMQKDTDVMTRQWVIDNPNAPLYIVVRANSLYGRGRLEEADVLYRGLMDIADLPVGLGLFVQRRIKTLTRRRKLAEPGPRR